MTSTSTPSKKQFPSQTLQKSHQETNLALPITSYDPYEPEEPQFEEEEPFDAPDPDDPENPNRNGNGAHEYEGANGVVEVGQDASAKRDGKKNAVLGLKAKKISKEKRSTTPYMTKYERARVLGTRALQIRWVVRQEKKKIRYQAVDGSGG